MTARELLEAAPELQPDQVWPEPLPLFRDPEAPEPFPLEALGVLTPVVRETLRIVQAPDALVAGSFLAAAAYAAQGLANLMVDGRIYPLSLFLLTIAESGERKSATDEIATRPIRERQKALHLAQQEALSVWEGSFALWEAERKRIISDKKQSREAREEALEALGSPPRGPGAESC